MTAIERKMPNEIVPQEQSPFLELMSRAMQSGQPAEAVASAMKTLGDLERQFRADLAAKQFTGSFALMQSEMPVINAERIIPDAKGGVRSRFASLDDILTEVKPFLFKHGFSISFDSESSEDRVTGICILSHVSGHSERRRFAVRNCAPPGASVAQGDGSTLTYAKRGAACLMLGLTICIDNDANQLGATIPADVAESLHKRAVAAGVDFARLLKLGGVAALRELPQGKLSAVEAVIREFERSKQGSATSGGETAGNAPPTPADPTGGMDDDDACSWWLSAIDGPEDVEAVRSQVNQFKRATWTPQHRQAIAAKLGKKSKG